MSYRYIENVVFFFSDFFKNENSWKELRKNQSFRLREDHIFQDEDPYFAKIVDHSLHDQIIKILKNTIKSKFHKSPNIALENLDIEIHFTPNNNCNLRIFLADSIDPDSFSFDAAHEKIYEKISEFLINVFKVEKKEDKLLKKKESYLYHQHIEDTTKDSKDSIEVQWSIYKYPHSLSKNEQILDLDTLILEGLLLYHIPNIEFIHILRKNSPSLQISHLKDYQISLNTYRYFIGNHYKLLEDLKSEYYEKYDTYSKKHKIDSKKELYNKLDANMEHLIDQLTNERQHKTEITIQMIFLLLGILGLISIIVGILALLPDAKNVCSEVDINQSSQIWKNTYAIFISYPKTILLILGFFGVTGIFLFYKLFKKVRNQDNYSHRK